MSYMRYIVSLFWLSFLSLQAGAQNSYSDVTRMFCEVADSCQKVLSKTDDLTVLLKPLDELILDDEYILSDFRGPFRPEPKDISLLRLYARKKSMPRPSDDYFNPEYSRYRKCLKEKIPYVTDADSVPFIFPFEKIRLTGSKMSFWQAYLLIYLEHMIGMRNEAWYNEGYLIVSDEDIERIISYIRDWEGDSIYDDCQDKDSDCQRHKIMTRNVIASLLALESKALTPIIEMDGDTVVIEHYAFAKFAGLVKHRVVLKLNSTHDQLMEMADDNRTVVMRYRYSEYI